MSCSITAGSIPAIAAYIADGDLFITGRIKDIIIRAGQHIAPHEIEQAVGAVPGIHKDGVAAFGVTDRGLGHRARGGAGGNHRAASGRSGSA